MNKLVVVLMAGAVAALTGCASVGHPSSQYSVQVNTDGRIGTHTGSANAYFFLFGLCQWGDSGVVAAAKNAGGKFICTVDNQDFAFLGLFGYHTTIVTMDDTK